MASSIFLDKFCLCIPLRAGAFIIGYVLSISKTILVCMTFFNVLVIYAKASQQRDLGASQGSLLAILYVVLAFIMSMEVAMSMNLLVGLHKKKEKHVKNFGKVYPYILIAEVIVKLIGLALVVRTYGQLEWILTGADAFGLLFEIYSIFVVRRYCLQLENTEQNQGVVHSEGNNKV